MRIASADWFLPHRRPHAAEEVYVTGSFDDWSKSEKLDKVGDAFEKTVTVPDGSEPILYKVGGSLSYFEPAQLEELARFLLSCSSLI